ncbi:MAG TPA: hypothetical protein G4O12_02995 [Dehalococcoidia bacterium]|nr:hypothetical protein [Dehalococcoidia bacterium]
MDYGQRLATMVGILLAITMLCGGSAFLSYIYGQDKGYDAGYQAAHEASYRHGYAEGNSQGYQVGYETGYQAGLKEGAISGYNLRNPTYREMKEFLAQDTTDSKKYIGDEYVCSDFCAEVNNNAEAQGIRCAIVSIYYPEGYGHNIVAFETTDKGLKFIEPQFDDEVDLIVGKSYSQINNYTPPPRADTIGRFLVIW